jgi:hypothetical protein
MIFTAELPVDASRESLLWICSHVQQQIPVRKFLRNFKNGRKQLLMKILDENHNP